MQISESPALVTSHVLRTMPIMSFKVSEKHIQSREDPKTNDDYFNSLLCFVLGTNRFVLVRWNVLGNLYYGHCLQPEQGQKMMMYTAGDSPNGAQSSTPPPCHLLVNSFLNKLPAIFTGSVRFQRYLVVKISAQQQQSRQSTTAMQR